VSVNLDITHTFNADLDIYLVGPGDCGTLELSTDNGSSGDNFSNVTLTTPSALPRS
jgi:subtilisin-like proprotein convertase family protein